MTEFLEHRPPYQQRPKRPDVADLLRAEVPVVPSGHTYAGGPDDWAMSMLPDVVRSAVVTDSLRAGLGLPLDENPCIVRSVN